jgi:hypothetical protein
MNTRPLVTLCLAGAVALACGSRSASSTADTRKSGPFATRLAVAAVAPLRRAQPSVDTGVSVRLSPAFAVTREDNVLRFSLTIRNEGKKDVELAFPSGQEYDFAVLDGRGREVYRWGNGRMFTQSRQNRMLDGGDTMEIEERASPDLAPGSYVAVATLRSSNFPVQQRVAFELR